MEEMASGSSCTAKVHLYFPKLEGSLLFRLIGVVRATLCHTLATIGGCRPGHTRAVPG